MSTNDTPKPVYGGQAVIEGVMMRGATAFAVAVRDPEGNIILHQEKLNKRIYDSPISRTPFLRGLTMLWDALGLGMKSLVFSAEVAGLEDDDDKAEKDPNAPPPNPADVFKQPAMIGTVLFSLGLSIGLFILLPAFIGGLLVSSQEANLLSNLVEGVVRLVLVIGYIWGIGRLSDIQRVFSYHGAEHKTIHAYEAGAELTPQSVARFPLEHPRCGTGFLLTVVVISILLFSFLPPMGILLRLLTRLLLIPVVAGIAYEYLRLTARHQDKAFVRALIKPNMALQKLTTREPSLDMLEVAIAAFEAARAADLGLEAPPLASHTADTAVSPTTEPLTS
ncbi:MAG: DUF1385 domain-containing protein [Anaerolineales bacterium]|nr:DUF1385 domain-containing protein [Anaerolineales bacterium]